MGNKQLVLILLITLIILMTSRNDSYASDNNHIHSENETFDEYDEEYEKAYSIAKQAMDAYEQLSDHCFQYDENRMTIYPDDYAGSWIEEGLLYIAVTPDADLIKYNETLSGFDCVRYLEKEYSVNELQVLAYTLEEPIKKKLDLCGYYVSYQENKIVFEITDNIVLAREMLDSGSLLDNDDYMYPINDIVKFDLGNKIQMDADVIGGTNITRNSSTGSRRTLGVAGTVYLNGNSYDGFVTAGHGLSTSGAASKIYKYNGSQMGYVRKANYYNGAVGDYALVELFDSYNITNKFYYATGSTSKRHFNGYVNDLAVGSPVKRYGAANGAATGTVKQQGYSATGNSVTIYGFTRCLLNSGVVGEGDSGGPCYTGSTGNYQFLGVYDGSGTNGGLKMFYLTPYCRFSPYFIPWIYD